MILPAPPGNRRLASRLSLERAGLILLALGALLYAAFPTRTYHWDGVLFSIYIEKVHAGLYPARVLLHPNHLLYSAAGYALFHAARARGFTVPAIRILQSLSIALGVLSDFLFFLLADRILRSRFLALACSIMFAFGALWWKYATDADPYVLTTCFLLLASLFVLAKPCKLLLTGLCHVAAMLFHELAVFFYVPVLVSVCLDPAMPLKAKLRRCGVYTVATGACVSGVYVACYMQSGHPANQTLLAWIGSHASDSQWARSLWELLVTNTLSYSKLFVGGKLAFLRDYFSFAVVSALLVCLVSFLAAIVLLQRAEASDGGKTDPRNTWFLWAWLAPYALFLAAFEPGNPIHKVLVWPPIVLLIGTLIAGHRLLRERQYAFAALAVSIAAWNFGAFAFPHSHDSADPVLSLAETIDKRLPRNATVYYRYLDPDDWYLEYFAPGRTWLPLPSEARTLRDLGHSTRGPVCFETTALEALHRDRAAGDRLAQEMDPRRTWQLVDSHHNIELRCLLR